jgi:hypothetical protein
MKVKDLIEALKSVDPDRDVIMSRDAEGNRFMHYADMSEARWEDGSDFVGLEPYQLTDELRSQGYTEEDVMDEDGSFSVLVLWPV